MLWTSSLPAPKPTLASNVSPSACFKNGSSESHLFLSLRLPPPLRFPSLKLPSELQQRLSAPLPECRLTRSPYAAQVGAGIIAKDATD